MRKKVFAALLEEKLSRISTLCFCIQCGSQQYITLEKREGDYFSMRNILYYVFHMTSCQLSRKVFRGETLQSLSRFHRLQFRGPFSFYLMSFSVVIHQMKLKLQPFYNLYSKCTWFVRRTSTVPSQ